MMMLRRLTGRIRKRSYTFLFISLVMLVDSIIEPSAPAMLVDNTVVRYVAGKFSNWPVRMVINIDNAGNTMKRMIIILDFTYPLNSSIRRMVRLIFLHLQSVLHRHHQGSVLSS
ncbi:MAG: hypothetical protein ACW986_19420 [Promethearchaeota archaeon]